MWIIPDCSLTFNEEIEIKLEGSILCKGTVVVTLVACESSFLEKESGKYFGPRCDVDEQWYIQFDLKWLSSSEVRRFRSLKQVSLHFVTNNMFRVSKVDDRCYDFLVVPTRASPVVMEITAES